MRGSFWSFLLLRLPRLFLPASPKGGRPVGRPRRLNTSPSCTRVEPDTNNTITCLRAQRRRIPCSIGVPASAREHLPVFSLGPPTLAGPIWSRRHHTPNSICFPFSHQINFSYQTPVLTVYLFPFPPITSIAAQSEEPRQHLADAAGLERFFLEKNSCHRGKLELVLLRASRGVANSFFCLFSCTSYHVFTF